MCLTSRHGPSSFAYTNPRKAAWPKADFVVGNPPFIGNWTMRALLGDGYAETLRAAYPEIPESADYVTFWWHRAAKLARARLASPFRVDYDKQHSPEVWASGDTNAS